jgi:DNA helicase-2/ATP-dependent DNA helicase PcrA
VKLINRIRSSVDDQAQTPRNTSPEGFVRFFCLPRDTHDKGAAEAHVAAAMAHITGDAAWKDLKGRKTLILEHHMAATRMGFLGLFAPLYGADDFRTGLLDGTLSITSLFAKIVLPFINAHRAADKFALGKIVRDASPLLSKEALKASTDQKAQLDRARQAADLLAAQFAGKDPSFRDIAKVILETELFAVPDAIRAAVQKDKVNVLAAADAEAEAADPLPEAAAAVEAFLDCPFSQIEPYAEYVSGASSFGTHQGVKGLEFPRVMVIIDDAEARGFTFKYDKLFSAATDGPIDDSEDSTADKTRRLFYVTCSRAEESLAIVGYTADPRALANQLVATGWFDRDEVISNI